MARDDKSRVIDRNLSVNFAAGSKSDQQLKARLQRLLDADKRFANKSDLGKHYILRGLEAEQSAASDDPAESEPTSNGEVRLALQTIQQQLADIRRSKGSWDDVEALLSDIDHRTRTLRPAFAEGIAMLLVQVGWDEATAAAWAKKQLLTRFGDQTRDNQ